MKAQRRHELQTNSLSQAIDQGVEFLRQHGSRVLLGAIFVVLLIVLIYQRIGIARERTEGAQTDLSAAWAKIDELKAFNRFPLRAEFLDEIAKQRQGSMREASEAISRVQKSSKDRQMLAQMHWASGDLNWQLANLPPLPGATTRPELRLGDSETYLKEAEAHYQTILKDYADQRLAVVAAHLGLAAIAENRHQWDTAADHYVQVSKIAEALEWAKGVATRKLGRLVLLQQPVLLATPATVPATAPATGPTTAASTRPAARPAESPATRATQPSTQGAP